MTTHFALPAMDGSDDCTPMASPTRDPKMMANFEEYKAIEVRLTSPPLTSPHLTSSHLTPHYQPLQSAAINNYREGSMADLRLKTSITFLIFCLVRFTV